jgi:hypothetical protein
MVEHVPNVYCVPCILLSHYLYQLSEPGQSNRLIEQYRIEGDNTSCHIMLAVVCNLSEHTIDQQTKTAVSLICGLATGVSQMSDY